MQFFLRCGCGRRAIYERPTQMTKNCALSLSLSKLEKRTPLEIAREASAGVYEMTGPRSVRAEQKYGVPPPLFTFKKSSTQNWRLFSLYENIVGKNTFSSIDCTIIVLIAGVLVIETGAAIEGPKWSLTLGFLHTFPGFLTQFIHEWAMSGRHSSPALTDNDHPLLQRIVVDRVPVDSFRCRKSRHSK